MGLRIGIKTVGGLFGAALGLWAGIGFALLGAIVGFVVSARLVRVTRRTLRQDRTVQDLFFRLAGFLCKASGAVTRRQVQATQSFLQTLDLSVADQKACIAAFDRGKQGLDLDLVVKRLRRTMPSRVQGMLLGWWLIRLIRSDVQSLHGESLTQRSVAVLGLPKSVVRLKKTPKSPEPLAPQAKPSAPPSAFDILGVPANTRGDALKKAYRRAISQNHPDKVAASGGDAEAIEAAKQNAQRIQQAWERVKHHA